MATAGQGLLAVLCLLTYSHEILADGDIDNRSSNQTATDGAESFKSRHDFSSVGIIVVIICTSVGGIGLIYALLYLCKVFCCDKNIPPVSIMIDPDEKSKDCGRLTDPPPLYDATVTVQPFSDTTATSILTGYSTEQPESDQRLNSCQLFTQAQSGRTSANEDSAESHCIPALPSHGDARTLSDLSDASQPNSETEQL